MAANKSKNATSVWFWLFVFLVLMIPLVNIVMTFVWAFLGSDQTRKNYFRALIVMWLLIAGVFTSIILFASWPDVIAALKEQLNRLPQNVR